MDLGELAATDSAGRQGKNATKPAHPFPSVKPATARTTAQTNSSQPRPSGNKKASFDAGVDFVHICLRDCMFAGLLTTHQHLCRGTVMKRRRGLLGNIHPWLQR